MKIHQIGRLAGVVGTCLAAAPGMPAWAEESVGARATIEEVVVTARKRAERLIDTPVAVSALTQDEIERYNTRDLAQLTERIPGVSIGHAAGGGAGGSISIRGVGNLAVDYGADQPVSLVLDGMSFTRGHVLDVGFFDVAAVEVLKGPQTLFFGKNSPAGVIAVTSVSPEVGGEFEMFTRASYEFVTEDPVLEAGFSFPVGDRLAFRLAGRVQDMQGGYLKNSARPIDPNPTAKGGEPTRGASYDKYPQQKQNVVRLTTVWEPAENFDATLKLFHSYSKQNDSGNTVLYACADGIGSHPYYNGGIEAADPTQTCGGGPRLERNGALPPASVANAHPFLDEDDRLFNRMTNKIGTLEMNYTVGDFTFTSVSAYWDYKHREYTNYDYTSYAVVVSKQGEGGDSFTQELRLQSNFEGPFNFMVGGFYEDMQRDLDAPVQILANAIFPDGFIPNADPGSFYFGSSINYHQHWDNYIESFSLFGSFDWQFAEQWELSGGARYTEEKRNSFGGNLYERGLGFSPTGVFYSPEGKSDNVSPELTLSWHPQEDVLVYGAYKSGFQSFGISNPGTVPNLSTQPDSVLDDYFLFDETTVDGFEFGVKGYFLDGRLSGDLALFRYESKDLQVAVYDPVTVSFATQNAAVAVNKGIELQTALQVNENLGLRLAGQYNWLEFKDYTNAGCYTGEPVGSGPPGCHPSQFAGVNERDLSGRRYGSSPLQINVGFTYDRPVMDEWSLELTADVIHHNKGNNLGAPGTQVPSRTVSNLAARLYQSGGPWQVSFICSNCANEIYVTGIGAKNLARLGDRTASIGVPRLMTLQVSYSL